MDLTRNETAEFLRTHDDYLLLTHVRSDGDTLGSASALCSALRRMGKHAWLFPNPDVTPRYLPWVEPFFGDGPYKTVIAVDIAGENRFPIGFEGHADLCIDHHPSNTRFADRLLLEDHQAACGITVLALIELLLDSLTKEEADLLYVAVSTDTGSFRYANTDGESFRAAAKLADAGADVAGLAKLLFQTASPARLALEGQMLSHMRVCCGGLVSIVLITREMFQQCGCTDNDTDDLAAIANRLEGCEAAVTIQEVAGGESHVSIRTGDRVNATLICRHFGGGGHARAAGCNIHGSAEEAARQLTPLLQEALGL